MTHHAAICLLPTPWPSVCVCEPAAAMNGGGVAKAGPRTFAVNPSVIS